MGFWGSGIELQKKLTENPFVVMEKEEMKRTVNSLYAVPKDTTVHFMTTSRPNIVFIILESWSAQMIKAFGGDNFAPFTDSLCRSGIYFSQFYANSNVSDQGIPAVLSGYPSCTENQIVNIIFKTHKMPAINQELEKIGYETAFYYGSNLSYGNIRLYVEDKKFQKIVDENELGNSGKLTSLGIHDKDMAKIFLGELNHAKHPFFYAWFTVSSHSPYRIPEPYRKRTESSQNPYINTIIYADEALKLFFQEARKQPWYNNTLFVLVSDHSHATHKPYWPHQKEFHQIPLVFFGNVIKEEFRGKNIDKVFSQTDIVPTLLRQMDLPSHRYIFGKNMMNPYTKPFAFYPFSRGCGYITSEGTVATAEWMKDTIEVQENKGKLKVAQVKQEMYALRQWLYDDFISR